MTYSCSTCGESVEGDLITFFQHTEGHIIDAIKEKHPEWKDEDGLCQKCVDYYKSQLKG